MTHKTFAETIEDRLELIELVVAAIAQGSRGDDLRDLRILLIDLMGLLKRDPGIEAAADDLYAAATALVTDSTAKSQPLARKLRLLKDARQRFSSRLTGAAERIGPQERKGLQGLAALYAAHIAFATPSNDMREPQTQSA